MFEEWLSEVQFGFFVCFKPYILLDYSFIDEIVDIFKEKSHTFLFINFRGREILAGGGKSQGAPPPLYETLQILDHVRVIKETAPTIGRRVAELELHIALSQLIRTFKVEFRDDKPMDYVQNLFLNPERRFDLAFIDL